MTTTSTCSPLRMMCLSELVFIIFDVNSLLPFYSFFFFFNDTATTEIYTLSLHDALPIWDCLYQNLQESIDNLWVKLCSSTDRKSTRLNSSHLGISYAVFCLKKKKKITNEVNY